MGDKTSTTFEPSDQQRVAIDNLLTQGGQSLTQLNAIPAWQGRATAAFDPSAFRGFDALNRGGRNAERAGGSSALYDLANKTARGDFLDVGSNPALQGLLQSILDPVQQNFQENVLPSIVTGATGSGAFDNIRRNLVTAQAGDQFTRNIGNLSSNVLGQNYLFERQNQNNAGSLFNQAAGVDSIAAKFFGQEAAGRQSAEQNEILNKVGIRGLQTEDATRALSALAPFQAILGGPGGTQTSQTQPGVGSILGQTLQGIAGLFGLGGGIASAFGGGGAGGGAIPQTSGWF